MNSEKRKLTFEEFQNEIIETFKKINSAFIENGIKWWAHAGTLLGAVRNNKQIPWDDDIDMGMSASDFYNNKDKIIEIASQNGLVLKDRKDTIGLTLNKMVSTEEVIVIYEGKEYIKSVFIDIFTYIPMKRKSKMRSYYWFIYNRIIFIFSDFWKPLPSYKMKNNELVKVSPFIHFIVWIGRLFVLPIGLLHFQEKWLLKKTKKNINSKYLGLYSGTSNNMDYVELDKLISWDFEGVKIFVPNNYENALITQYGKNYISPPPVSQQNPKHILKTPNL